MDDVERPIDLATQRVEARRNRYRSPLHRGPRSRRQKRRNRHDLQPSLLSQALCGRPPDPQPRKAPRPVADDDAVQIPGSDADPPESEIDESNDLRRVASRALGVRPAVERYGASTDAPTGRDARDIR